MRSWSLGVFVALAIPGCDRVFGLTGRDSGVVDALDAQADVMVDADPCPNDRDCDLVLDLVDNCVDVANSDQDDIDDDDVGDLCDACFETRSNSNDDDVDTVADSIDNCPARHNVTQVDGDGDGVGDACDPRPGQVDALGCYLAFAEVDLSRRVWSTAVPWSVTSSSLLHFPPDTAPFTLSPTPSGVLAGSTGFELETVVTHTTTFSPYGVGVAVASRSTGRGVRCVLDGAFQTANTLTLGREDGTVIARTSVPAFVGGQQVVSLQLDRTGGTAALRCTLVDGVSSPIQIAGVEDLEPDLDPRLVADRSHVVFLGLAILRLEP